MFEWVKFRSHLSRGVTVGTMLMDDSLHFIRIGTFLERADNTARLLDVKFHALAGDEVGTWTDDNAPETTDAEFVSLEEADAEKKTGKVNTAIDVDDDIDIDEDLGDDDDSTFIPDEEEGDDDVTDIIGDVDSDDDT